VCVCGVCVCVCVVCVCVCGVCVCVWQHAILLFLENYMLLINQKLNNSIIYEIFLNCPLFGNMNLQDEGLIGYAALLIC